MSELAKVDIDLAKTIFQIHGVDESGRVLVRRQLRRSQLRQQGSADRLGGDGA